MDTTEHPVTATTTLREEVIEVSALASTFETARVVPEGNRVSEATDVVIQPSTTTDAASLPILGTMELPSASTTSSEGVVESSPPISTSETFIAAHDGTTVTESTVEIASLCITTVGSQETLLPRRKKYRLSTKWYLVKFRKDSVLHVCQDTEFVYRRRERDRKIVPFGKYGRNWYECVLLAENCKKAYLQQELHAAKKRSSAAIGRRGRKNGNFSLVRFCLTHDHQILPSSELGVQNEFGYCSIKCPDGAVRLAIVIQRGTVEDLTCKLAECINFDQFTTPEKTKRRHPYVPFTPRVNVPLLSNTQTTCPAAHLSALHSPDVKKSPRQLLSLVSKTSPQHHLSPLLQGSSYKSRRSFKRSASMQSSSSSEMIALPRKRRLFDDSPDHSLKMEEPDMDFKDIETLTLPSTMITQEDQDSDVDPLDTNTDEPNSPHSDVDPIDTNTDEPNSPHSDVDPYATDSGTDYEPSSASSVNSSPAPSVSSELETSASTIFEGLWESPLTCTTPTNGTKENIKAHDDDIGTAGPSSTKTKLPYKRKAAACVFCNAICVRVQRHMATVHKNQPQVVRIMSITDKNEKRLAWKQLRLQGNYKYNCGVLQSGEGEMILQRSNPSYRSEDYLPCVNCKGFFKRQAMYKHVKRCKSERQKYERVQSLGLLSIAKFTFKKPVNKNGLRLLTTLVFPRMLADKFTYAAQADELIVLWGINYCLMKMQEKRKAYLYKVASHKMRTLARLLLALKRKHGKNCTLQSFLVPQSFDDVVEATATICGLKEGEFSSPSLSIDLGHTLKACASILQGDASRTGDDVLHESAGRFLRLMKEDWKTQLTALATRQLKRNKFQNPSTKVLPLAGDVMLFSQFLQKEESRLLQRLDARFTYNDWVELTQALLCSLIVFNRKRVGDIEKIEITSFQNKSEASPDSAIYEALGPSERIIAASYRHFYTTGKKDSQVPVMVPVTQIPAFDLMISLRKKAGVEDGNIYLFGRNENSFFNGCHAMRILSEKSGAKKFHLLRSTKLRKQIATMSQVMNMKPGDLDVLASYLGHSIEVHRQFYRLPDEALHLAKISRLLVAVSSGNVESLRGKSLDELPAPDNDTDINYLDGEDINVVADTAVHSRDSPDDSRDSPDDSRDSPLCKPSSSNFEPNEPQLSTLADSPVRPKRLCPPSSERHGPQNCKPWSIAEKEAVRRHFSVAIEEQICPKKAEVDYCLQQEPILRSRTWRIIKACVRNMAVTRARQKQNAKNMRK